MDNSVVFIEEEPNEYYRVHLTTLFGRILSKIFSLAPFRWVYFTLRRRWFISLVMKRMKRFVLAHSTEKDPIWKSSDNLLAGVAKMMAEKNETNHQDDDVEEPEDEGLKMT